MNDTEIIKAVAELDGLVRRQALNDTTWAWFRESRRITEWTDVSNQVEGLPRYLTSYDAIMPVIEKQDEWAQRHFIEALQDTTEEISVIKLFFATPRQLCEALLKSVGKWKG